MDNLVIGCSDGIVDFYLFTAYVSSVIFVLGCYLALIQQLVHVRLLSQ